MSRSIENVIPPIIVFVHFFGCWCSQIMRLLKERTTRIDSAVVEDNKYCISVHYRCVHEKVILTRSLYHPIRGIIIPQFVYASVYALIYLTNMF